MMMMMMMMMTTTTFCMGGGGEERVVEKRLSRRHSKTCFKLLSPTVGPLLLEVISTPFSIKHSL